MNIAMCSPGELIRSKSLPKCTLLHPGNFRSGQVDAIDHFEIAGCEDGDFVAKLV